MRRRLYSMILSNYFPASRSTLAAPLSTLYAILLGLSLSSFLFFPLEKTVYYRVKNCTLIYWILNILKSEETVTRYISETHYSWTRSTSCFTLKIVHLYIEFWNLKRHDIRISMKWNGHPVYTRNALSLDCTRSTSRCFTLYNLVIVNGQINGWSGAKKRGQVSERRGKEKYLR